MAFSFGNLSLSGFLAAYSSGTKIPTTGFVSGGSDLCNSFQPSAGLWDRGNGSLGLKARNGKDLDQQCTSSSFTGLTLTNSSVTTGAVAHNVAQLSSGNSTVQGMLNSGSLTYTWTRTSGSTTITANTPNGTATRFYYNTGGTYPGAVTANFTCNVSDGTNSINVGSVTVTFTFSS